MAKSKLQKREEAITRQQAAAAHALPYLEEDYKYALLALQYRGGQRAAQREYLSRQQLNAAREKAGLPPVLPGLAH